MNRENQQMEERDVVKLFLQQIGLSEEATKCEHPDFILEVGSKKIGIELTEFMLSEIREKESHEAVLRELLKPIAQKFHVTISPIFGQRNIPRSMFNEVAENIGNYVGDLSDAGWPTQNKFNEWVLMNKYGLDQYFYAINIYEGLTPFVGSTHGFHGRYWKDEVETIKQIISNKNQKYSDYIQNCDECWLLIHHSGLWWSPMESVLNFPPDVAFETHFSKAFVMDCFTKECSELTVYRPNPVEAS